MALERYYRTNWDDIIDESCVDETGKCRLMFGDYLVPGADQRVYEEVVDVDALVPKMEEYLSDYNSESKVWLCV